VAVEPKRGCGYRKAGGTYLVGKSGGLACCRMPILLHVCPTCNHGIKQSRGWTWIDPRPFLVNAPECVLQRGGIPFCPAATGFDFGKKVGLIWIGEQFYPTPEHFMAEAKMLGISRRVAALPRGVVIGESWVWLAHKKAVLRDGQHLPGVFYLWKPEGIERIVTATQAKDEGEMKLLTDRGITPFVVPDNDPDHVGDVYDDRQTEIPMEEQ
jgi:hypothetical protein